MATITWADVVSIAPELGDDAVALELQTDVLALANGRWKRADAGSTAIKIRLARMFYAAAMASSLIASAAGEDSEGEIKAESVGGVSVTYEAGAGPGTAATATDYEAGWRELIASIALFRGPRVTG